MGRIGSLFKKSDDKQAPAGPATSNPYAQQQPPPQRPQGSNPYAQDQHETYSQYNANQFNANQYNVNQQYSQGRQGPASGLPSGPRPGGLPSRVAPGRRGPGTGESNDSVFPGYAEQPIDSQPPPPYYSPSLASTGGSPALPSNRASPSVGTGYPREKFGASDGVGRNRFESSAPSSYDRSPSLPSQRQGGYGNLDTENGGLFSNYNGPSKQTFDSGPGSSSQQPYAQPHVDMTNMTAEERDQAQANLIDGETKQIRNATEDSLDNSLGLVRQFREQSAALREERQRQHEALLHANTFAVESEVQVVRGDLNVRDLAHATRSMFIPQSKHREGLNDERLRQDLEAKQLRHEARMMKGKEDQTRMQPAPQRKLGAGGDRSHIKQFVFEEDDEVQEMRISDKTDELLEATFYAKAEAVELGKDIEKDNALIASMSERSDRVHDKLLATRNRMNRIK